jgi:DNA polymerase (family 10)
VPSNAEVARKLLDIRTLMELDGESFHRYSAFERAAATLENASPVEDLIAAGELLSLPGVGKSIGAAIAQIVATGTADALEGYFTRYPRTIFEVLGVSGIGAKTGGMLFSQYGIGSLAQLEAAIDGGALEGAPRLGPKTLENWKRGILAYKGRQARTPLPKARRIAREAIAYLEGGPPLHRLLYAGSLRRQEVTVGDVDIVCTSDDAVAVTAHFAKWDRAAAVVAEGPTKCSIWLESGLQIDLRVLPDRVYGNLLQHFTGSREHNIKLREYSVRKGLRVSENGILNLATGEAITCTDEESVYEALGMQYIPPELRQGLDEVDRAIAREIPRLIERGDLRGDFHMHCDFSDGDDTLEAMIAASAALGYEYHAMSDHSQGRGSYGMSVERLREQRARIALLAGKYGIRTLRASEVDILPDGSLDYPPEALDELDVVIGSVHSSFNQTREQMTARLIRACENPYVTLIGHPTGRMVGGFNGYEFDYDAVFAAAARTGTSLEIDGQAARLDLPSPLARRAKAAGATFALDSDAHATEDLEDVDFAVGQARRAGLEVRDVLNALPLDELLARIARKRKGAS